MELEPNVYWYDRSIIKAFDADGNEHKVYRLKVENDLSMSYSQPDSYLSQSKMNFITHMELVKLKENEILEKENQALNLIREKFDKFDNYIPLVPISTGKDSMVTLHLTRKIKPATKAIFNNTTLDVADTYLMVKTIDNCEIMNPDKGFYQYVESDHMIPTRFARFCCRIFKVGVMVEKLDHDIPYLMMMGMRNEESATRAGYQDEWINETEWGKTNWQGILPIRTWSELDVWLYTLYRNLPINPKYKKGYSRVGCGISCPYYNKSTWVLDDYWYPTMRQRWLDILEKDFLDNSKWGIMNCTLEEYKQVAWSGGMYRDEPTEEVITEMQKYKGIEDREIVMKYFNNHCHDCGKKVKKDEVGLSMKFLGTDTDRVFCWKCLGKNFAMSKKQLKEIAEMHKNRDCVLF